MSRKSLLIKSVINILSNNRDGSMRTQNDRRRNLLAIAESVYQAGFQLNHIRYLKHKHVRHLVAQWQAEKLSVGTIKNRLSNIRWIMRKLNQEETIKSNDDLHTGRRQYVTHQDKSRELTLGDLDNIRDPMMQLSLMAQRLFGLRVEESMKIQPKLADQGDYLRITKSKGNRERYIPIRTKAQHDWLEQAKAMVKRQADSLIPRGVKYSTYKSRFEKACLRANIRHMHGHRHSYAHERYQQITGFACQAKGGPTPKSMTQEQRELANKAMDMIAHELGHGREQITAVYV